MRLRRLSRRGRGTICDRRAPRHGLERLSSLPPYLCLPSIQLPRARSSSWRSLDSLCHALVSPSRRRPAQVFWMMPVTPYPAGLSTDSLDLDPADNVERQFHVDGFVGDRLPSFRGTEAAVSVPSIAQLYTQSKGEAQQNARNLDCAQNEGDAGQPGDRNEEVGPGQQTGTPTGEQSRHKRFLCTIICGMAF